jgi:uncharacterized protein YbaR (Trm112 family)/ubiquinone/menaquinone biosynthesis C-methylase UbiE
MKKDPFLINLLCCPACRDDLRLHKITETSPDGHIMTGELMCEECHAAYPILGGVPRFVPNALTADVSSTVEGFGYEWKYSNPLTKNKLLTAAETFLDFIYPVQSDYFKDKIVLDVGCGLGRFSVLSQESGAKAVVGLDLSGSVDVAFENTRSFPNVLIVQADLFSPPLRPSFDYVFSIGVLDHTPDPRGAFDSIVALSKSGGGVSAWVYARENNGWIIYLLNPIRRSLTSRLPRNVLRAISYAITVPMFLVLKGIYRPVGKFTWLARFKKYLFYFDYLYFLSAFGFHEQALVVFDHLVPVIAEYIPYDEFAKWFDENELSDVVITLRNGNSWRGFGVRP